MTSWGDVERDAPEFAARVRAVFDARRHKTIATLRRDGSPRISGIEVEFRDGEMVVGLMPGSLKLADIQRDPRVALHAASPDPDDADPGAWPGDAKIGGIATEHMLSEAPTVRGPRYQLDLSEVVLTRVGSPADHLVIESWHPGRGLESRKRY